MALPGVIRNIEFPVVKIAIPLLRSERLAAFPHKIPNARLK